MDVAILLLFSRLSLTKAIMKIVKLGLSAVLVASVSFCFAQKKSPVVVATPVFKKDTFNIIKFGAKADGVTLNTKAINSAIDACNKKGGGVVLVPEGFWLTGPIELKSNVNLHLKRNAVVQTTGDFNQFKLIASNWEGLPQMRNQSPISATNATNIAVTGFGIIDGNGDAWRMVKKEKLSESNWKKLVASGGVLSDDKKTWYPTAKSFYGSKFKNPGAIAPGKTAAFYDSVKDFLRPNLLVFTNCKKILLEGVTFQNSPAWNLHPLMCQDLTVRNVQVKNPWYAQNGDGIDLESCKNVLVENSVFDVGDDGLCIKSGRDAEGRKRAMPTENVIIRNCVVYAAHGGFVVGSEMSGGAKNIWVDNCTFVGTDIGIRFKTTRGRGGVVENIYISNITMKDIIGEAILFDMYYEAKDPIALAGERREPPKVETRPVTEETPVFRNVYVNNVVCDGAEKAIFVRGLPEMNVQSIFLENMTLQAKHGLDMTEGTGISLKNISLFTKDTDPVMNIHNSNNITLDGIRYNGNAELMLNVSGEKSKGITLIRTDHTAAKKGITFTYGATEDAAIILMEGKK
jgi:polygalacturonase